LPLLPEQMIPPISVKLLPLLRNAASLPYLHHFTRGFIC